MFNPIGLGKLIIYEQPLWERYFPEKFVACSCDDIAARTGDDNTDFPGRDRALPTLLHSECHHFFVNLVHIPPLAFSRADSIV